MAEERVEPDLKVLNSYLVMQSFIRQLIQEAASYGMNQLMIEISRVNTECSYSIIVALAF